MPKEILIVDDEPGIVVPVQFLMEQQGYSVIIAENGIVNGLLSYIGLGPWIMLNTKIGTLIGSMMANTTKNMWGTLGPDGSAVTSLRPSRSPSRRGSSCRPP